ncbi:MAG: glucuronate isomerase, partial [bacterium]|nr:glucuronate isomerase [bacterium]
MKKVLENIRKSKLSKYDNNNSRLLSELGPDTGFDSMGDFSQSRGMSRFLNKLDST